jgi:cation diffusion facilitator family transporter
MAPERRTALVSIGAALALIVIKLSAGLGSGSLGLVAEAAHSGTDLVAAILTFFAVGFARKPADSSHLYGHGKAEHLAALAEASFLAVVSLGVGAVAVARLSGSLEAEVNAAWWAFAAAGLVLLIDLVRTSVSLRTARRYQSEALLSNALHFAGDFAGTVAVLAGLVAVRAGWAQGDSLAALFVAVLVVVAAARLIQRNVDVLMDRAPASAMEAAQAALDALEPSVQLRRLRLRQAAGRAFADVVIGVSPDAAVGQGHAAADRVEAELHRALPGIDVVVHVEPLGDEAALRERIGAAAMTVSFVREVHNVSLIDTDAGVEVSLHLKLPGSLTLEEAHAIADRVEHVICDAVPEVSGVQTHLEPLSEEAAGREVALDPRRIEQVVAEATGTAPREVRFLHTDEGLVVYLTFGLDGSSSLADAHMLASRVEEAVRHVHPEVAEVIAHTEP